MLIEEGMRVIGITVGIAMVAVLVAAIVGLIDHIKNN